MSMRPNRSRIGRPTSSNRSDKHDDAKSEHLDEGARRLTWAIAAVSSRLQDLNQFWAETLGVSGPQWMILMAVDHFKTASGAPVREIATKLEVDPSFVASQSKLLEKAGFLDRSTSKEDSRVVLLSLTALAQTKILVLENRRSTLNQFVYEDLSPRELDDFVSKLTSLSKRLEKASLRLELEA